MRISSLALTAAFAALLPAAPVLAADNDFVECRGEAPAAQESARTVAMRNAQRDCVEKKFGSYVVADSQTKDFQLMKDAVMSTAQGYVTDIEVLEEKAENGVFVVRIKAKVAQGRIDEDAKARHLTLAAMKFPRIALLMTEQHIGQTAPGQWWNGAAGGAAPGAAFTVDQRLAENIIIGEWKAAGDYRFVDLEALSGKLRGIAAVGTDPSKAVRELSNLLDADLILFGSSVAQKKGDLDKLMGEEGGRLSGMVSCQASISLRAFSSDSGEIMAVSEAAKTKTGLGDLACERLAAKDAAKAVAKDLERKLLIEWNKKAMGGGRVRLLVRGADFSTVSAIKKALREVYGITFEAKNFANGQADFDLVVEGGDAQALAEKMDETGFGKATLKVVGVTGSTITLEK